MPEGLLFFVKPFNQFVQRSKYGGAICWTFNYMINGMGERTLLETSVNMPTSSTDVSAAFQKKVNVVLEFSSPTFRRVPVLRGFWDLKKKRVTQNSGGPLLTQNFKSAPSHRESFYNFLCHHIKIRNISSLIFSVKELKYYLQKKKLSEEVLSK